MPVRPPSDTRLLGTLVCVGSDAGGLALRRPFYLKARDAEGVPTGKGWRGPDSCKGRHSYRGHLSGYTTVPPTNSDYLHALGQA